MSYNKVAATTAIADTKKSVRKPVGLVKRHGGKTTQPDRCPKAVPVRFVVDSTRRAAGYAGVTCPLPSLDKQLWGRLGKANHPRTEKRFDVTGSA